MTVVERNGYSAAAEHLDVSQATVSFHVQALERFFGAKLLVYEKRAIHLTPAGQEVYRAAGPLLQESERLAQSVRDVRHGRRGRVSIGASMAFEQPFFFRRVIAPFARAHEGTHLSLRFGHSVAEAEAVQRHELDLAYVIGWQLPSGVRYEPLHSARFTFLIAPSHGLAGRDIVTVDDVAEAGIIAAPLDSLIEPAREGTIRVRPTVRASVSSRHCRDRLSRSNRRSEPWPRRTTPALRRAPRPRLGSATRAA